ncbi:hypothetical protein EIK77_000659 [Talaromyces pinophilus]|nr:hypothetical protein EIK77_000659 [Talaromyces pinophilus]PCG92783.1 Hypothetical protein PENO1_086970 [Penicillium occitanis (nom. inval.)]PCG93021.1 hypothetical protein PENOC_089800 [Penicillium occitanis (nom. inval.)]
MTSIGRITGALINGTLEPAVALANLNFDFTLIKVDTPREFDDVGSQLSAQRRNNAEAGPSHVLARKLGALFRDVVPPTPELVKAYGNRASAIFNSTVAQNQAGALHGFFAGIVGADATSMWAAATSGKHAIACHLLACLLARIWDATEATSHWMELITRRKREINSENEGIGDPALEMVSRESFQRNELADWDASARAWLRVADSAMALQQTQVRLILDNITLPVNYKTDTYESIIEAWKSSLQQMERLLVGHPQEARDGAIILGLSAWHLYPDMIVLGSEEKDVKQKDPLFQGRGILTLGLTREEDTPECQGVYWSLPLRYLRHYGLPVLCKRSLHSSEGNRISIDQLLLAWTAAYIRPWDDGSLPTESVLTFFAQIADHIYDALGEIDPEFLKNAETYRNCSWLRILSEQAKRYLNSVGPEKKVLEKLWKLGDVHCPMFRHSQPFFNFFTPSNFLRTARSLEQKVECLREVVEPIKRSCFLIRYQYDYHPKATQRYEYATAVPQVKRSLDGKRKENHTRWIWKLPPAREERTDEAEQLEENISLIIDENLFSDDPWAEHHASVLSGDDPCDTQVEVSPQDAEEQAIRNATEARETQLLLLGESVESVQSLRGYEDASCTQVLAPESMAGLYVTVQGDESCQLLRRLEPRIEYTWMYENGTEDRQTVEKTFQDAKADFEFDVKFTTSMKLKFLNPTIVSFQQCAQLLATEFPLSNLDLVILRGISTIMALYESSQSATVDVRSVKLDLLDAKWLLYADVENHHETSTGRSEGIGQRFGPIQLDYAASFACIAMMETGRFNLDPGTLEGVTALSSGDSLYVPSSLLHDPVDNSHRFRIQHLTGNIGRAGIAFLLPPKNPMIKVYDALNDWQLVDYADFDGRLQNNFASTSLQLSFTEATFPLNVGFSGGVDIEAYFLETLVSVYDSGRWVADLDVLKALESTSVIRVSSCPDVRMDTSIPKLTSVDRFAEMLCEYGGIGIVRAWGNWQARLAATAICFAKGYHVVIMNEKVCWRCVEIQVDRLRNSESVRKVVIIS